jgi:Tfp pilus assembly protein PilO
MQKFIKTDFQVLSLPIGILIGIIILFAISAKIVFDNISRLNSEMTQNYQSETDLNKKLSSLQKITPQVSDQSQTVITALPGVNSALNAVQTIQIQSLENSLVLSNLRSESIINDASTTVNSTEIDFDADGDYKGIANFVIQIRNSLPINRFDSIKIKSTNANGVNIYHLTSSLFSYWSPLPSNIPAIDQPIVQLTPEENNLLSKIALLRQTVPNITNASSSAVPVGKTNPFQ